MYLVLLCLDVLNLDLNISQLLHLMECKKILPATPQMLIVQQSTSSFGNVAHCIQAMKWNPAQFGTQTPFKFKIQQRLSGSFLDLLVTGCYSQIGCDIQLLRTNIWKVMFTLTWKRCHLGRCALCDIIKGSFSELYG